MPDSPKKFISSSGFEDSEGPDICPHVNLNDARCSSRFSLGRMDQTFSVCFGAYRGCPMYHRINGEIKHRNRVTEMPAIAGGTIVTLTSGCAPITLRPTGS